MSKKRINERRLLEAWLNGSPEAETFAKAHESELTYTRVLVQSSCDVKDLHALEFLHAQKRNYSIGQGYKRLWDRANNATCKEDRLVKSWFLQESITLPENFNQFSWSEKNGVLYAVKYYCAFLPVKNPAKFMELLPRDNFRLLYRFFTLGILPSIQSSSAKDILSLPSYSKIFSRRAGELNLNPKNFYSREWCLGRISEALKNLTQQELVERFYATSCKAEKVWIADKSPAIIESFYEAEYPLIDSVLEEGPINWKAVAKEMYKCQN